MAFSQNIVNVAISLQTTPVTSAGFGVPIFASEHRWFTERVRSYTDITGVAADFPATSAEYAAASAFFSPDTSPSLIKIGRRFVDSITFTPEAATAIGQVYTVTITAASVDYTGTFTTITGSEAAAAIVTGVTTAISAISGVTLVNNGDTFTIGTALEDTYSIKDISRLGVVYTSTETAADMVSEIEQVDDEWYFMTTNDHSADFIIATGAPATGMAEAIEARDKLFFTSSAAPESLVVLTDIVDVADVAGLLAEGEYFRSVCVFHQDADTAFPECSYIGYFAPFAAGTVVWTQKNIGVSLSKDPDTGLRLSPTQLINLAARNCSFIQSQGGVSVIRQGLTSGGENIDVMRFRDFLSARITEALQIHALNTLVTPYTDTGINTKRSVVETVLSRYVSTAGNPQGLQETNAFTTRFPLRRDTPINDVITGVLNATFTGYLRGAIKITNITGILTFEGLAG